jgi:hypothetical protein
MEQMVGTDYAALVAQKAHLQLLMAPPTKSQTVCTTTGPPSRFRGRPTIGVVTRSACQMTMLF